MPDAEYIRQRLIRIPVPIRVIMVPVDLFLWIAFGWIIVLYTMVANIGCLTVRECIQIYFGAMLMLPLYVTYCNILDLSGDFITEGGALNDECMEWLKENINYYTYAVVDGTVFFLQEHDAMAFKLRWT